MLNFSVLRGYSGISRIAKGRVITDKDYGTDMIIIMHGTLAVLDQNNKLIKTAECGEILNELGVFGEEVSSVKALAVTDSVIISVSKSSIHNFIGCEPEFTFELMRYMCAQYCQPAVPSAEAGPAEPAVTVDAAGIHGNGDIVPSEFQCGYKTIRYQTNPDQLWKKRFTCPVCRNQFQAEAVKTSRLSLVEVHTDMRKVYEAIDPIQYDIVTCPACYYSTFGYCFDQPVKECRTALTALHRFKASLEIDFNHLQDDVVFIQYYLAIFCAKQFLYQPSMQIAKMFMRLAWLYGDCKESAMEKESLENALKYYTDSYMELDLAPEQDQQVCMIIGELNFKLHNSDEAKQYYFRAKMNKEGIPALRRQAEDRLQKIK